MCGELHISGGFSFKNSITLTADREFSVKAIREKDGSITISEKKNGLFKDVKDSLMGAVCTFGLMREIWVFIGEPTWAYHIPTIILILYLLLALGYAYLFCSEICMYHGAEHKVIEWYNKNGTIPNMEELQKVSRISPHCGTNLLVTIVIFQLLSSVCMICFNVHITELITVVLPFYVNHRRLFTFLGGLAQYLTTKEPRREHLEVAIAALKSVQKAGEN